LQPVVWYDTDGQGNPRVTRFIYALGRNSPDLMVRDEKVYRLIADHVGSVRLVVDISDGSVAQRIDYDAWGNVTYEDGAGFQPFGFGGGIVDRDTGLVRLGARDYSPQWGRWTTKDSLRFDGGSTNLYLYADGDPINTVDPGGRMAWAAWFLVGMVATAPFVENCGDWGGHVGMVEGGLWASGLGPMGEALAGNVAARFAARGGGAFAAAEGQAWPIALHGPNKPWWRWPSYTGVGEVFTEGRTGAQIARAINHEQAHIWDFGRFPMTTHIASKVGYFPGKGLARWFLERRGYNAAGDFAFGAPFRSMRAVPGVMTNFYLDVGLVGLGATAGGTVAYIVATR